MQTLSALVADVKKENKIPVDELLAMLADCVENEDETSEVYKAIYKKAYGNHLSKETADSWVRSIAVTDGSNRTTGEKWSIEQTTEVGNKVGVNFNTINRNEWYAVMNAWYSDFYRTAKKYELENDPEFYADLVIDYFCYDTDGKNKSVFCYYFNHVV